MSRMPPASLSRNIGWFALSQGWSLVLSVASAITLARLLLPDDYAVAALVVPLIGAAQMVQSLGIGSAIIQAPDISKRQLDALFWLGTAFAIGLAVLVALAGPVLAHWLLGLQLRREFGFASLAIVVAGLASQPNALLARSLRFRALALRNMLATALGVVVTVAIAARWHSHWALLVNLVLVPLVQLATSARIVRWRPGLLRRDMEIAAIMHFGLRVWITNCLRFVASNSDNLIVAGATNPHQLGIYDRSYRVLLYPLTQAVNPLGQVIIPTLTRTLGEPARYVMHYRRVLLVLLLACLPGLALMAVFPRPLIGLLLGAQWLEGARLFAWFALAAAIEVTIATFGWLLLSQGRGTDVLRAGLVNAGVALASFAVGIVWGIAGVAIAFAVGRALLCLPYTLWLTGRAGPLGHRSLLVGLAPHALGFVAVLAALMGFLTISAAPHWSMLVIAGGSAYLLYGAVLFAIPPSRELLTGLLARLVRLGAVHEAASSHDPRQGRPGP
jgi:PST family polysaccharide transporter